MMFFFSPMIILFFTLSFLLPLFLINKRKRRDYYRKNSGKYPDMDDLDLAGFSGMFQEKENRNSYTGDIYRLADKYNGRITISDVIIQTGLNLKDAERVMNGLVDGQHVCMEVNDDGWIIYEFPEIIARRKAINDRQTDIQKGSTLIQ